MPYVEGIDLSGKSSAIEHFVSVSSSAWEVRHGHLGSGKSLYDLATEAIGSKSLDEVGELYAFAVQNDLNAYKAPEIATIQDSLFTVRSLAFFMALQNDRLVATFEDLLQRQPAFEPAFVFTASAAARQARLQQRMAESPEKLTKIDQILVGTPDLAAAVNANIIGLTQEAFSATIIDTTNLSIVEVGNLMRDEIETNR